MANLARITTIEDWRLKETASPFIPPGEEYEHVIAPQKFCVLLDIAIRHVVLVRLRIGAVDNVPFERLPGTDVDTLTYRPCGLHDVADLRDRLVKTGASVPAPDAIGLVPGLEVRMTLRNQNEWAMQFRAALVVEEQANE